MAAIDPRIEILVNGTWTDISTAYAGASQGASITRGLADETSNTDAATLTVPLRNTDGRFSQRNPLGPYYPYLVRNTQVRVSVPEGASYLRAENDQGSYAYCNDSAGISVTGDTEIQLDVTLDNWRSQQALAGKWFGPMGQRSWRLVLGDDGTLTFRWSADGVSTSSAQSTVPVPAPPLRRQAIKVTIATASGTVAFWTAPAGKNQVLSGPITAGWVQLGSAAVAGATSIFDSTSGLYVSGVNQIGWMSDAANIHSCHLADATTTRAFFDTPDSFSSGGSPTTDPRQDGYQSQALLNYTVYTQFLADITGVNQTIGANTYTPRAINTSVYSWVRFDIESWVQSDVTEKADPQTYIGNFIALAHAHAFKCIITPGRDLGNTDTAHPKLTGESLDQWYVRTNLAAACAGADAFEVQDQANQVTPAEFAGFFSTVRAQAKAASANLPVWCGISTTYGNGLNLYNSALAAPLADGFWINIIGDTANSLDFMRRWLAAPMVPQIPNMQGKTHSLKLLSGIGGTVKASPDFTAQTAGAASFTDAQSNTFKLWATTEISNRRYRMHGEVAAWPQTWDPSGRAVWVDITANGLLRRLGQGSKPLNTPMTRYWQNQAGAVAPVAYWTCEDGPRSSQIASGLPGGLPLAFANGTPKLASDSSFIASAPLPVLNGATLGAGIPVYTGTDCVFTFLVHVPAAGDTDGSILFSAKLDGSISELRLTYNTLNGGTLTASAIDAAGAFTQNLFSGAGNNGQKLIVRIWLQNLTSSGAGPLLTFGFQLLQPGGAVETHTAQVTCNNIGQARGVTMNPQTVTQATGTSVGHIALQSLYTDLSAVANALNAYSGEAAAIRFQRLCGEQGIRFYGQGQLSASSPMGAQPQDVLVSLLQACAAADNGLMAEPRQQLGLGYITRYALSNQSPAVTLDYQAANISDLQPTDDDQYTQNDVTVARQGGSSSRQVLTSGPLSVLAPPNGVGLYDTQQTLSLFSDTQALDEAGWLLHLGTVSEPRYPALALNLRKAALAAIYHDLQDTDLGNRYAVINTPLWLPPDGISQIIHQQAEQLSSKVFAIAWTGVPESPYQTMILDDPVLGRVDTDGTTLSAAVNAAQAQLIALSGTGPAGNQFALWTTQQADFPFDISMGGERITAVDIQGPPDNFLTGDNSTFDASAGNWAGAGNCAVAQVNSPVYTGTGALRVRSSAAGDMTCASCAAANILTQGLPCAAGDTILCGNYFSAAVSARVCSAGAQFYTSGGVSISQLFTSGTLTDSAFAYTKLAGTVIAPATSAFCRLLLKYAATGAANEDHFADCAFIADVTTGAANKQTFTAARSVNGVVRAHSPGEDIRLFTPTILAM